MCTERKLAFMKMDSFCDHSTFVDSDDENLLLDDDNTAMDGCSKCSSRKLNGARGSDCFRINNPICTSASSINVHSEEQLDSPEDSPLLRNDHIKKFGPLSIKDFHCHSYTETPEHSSAYKTLCIVSILCFLFMVTEIVGGYIAGSLAVMTDAAHLFSDLIGFMLSIVSIWISKKPPTSHMTFGYHRAEVMGAFFSVLAVWLLAGTFSIIAVDRIIREEYKIKADTMLIIAGLGLVINIIMGAVLHGFCFNTHTHSHGFGGDHSHNDNINIRAAAAHVIGDLLQSLGVLVAAIIIKLCPSAQIADPICTILFSVIVVIATLRVGKDSILLLVEASPSCSKEISFALKSIVGVKHVHSLHIWSLAPGKEAIATHLAVDDNCDRDVVLNQATFVVKNKLKVVSCTIQIEPYDHEQMSTCSECQLLQC